MPTSLPVDALNTIYQFGEYFNITFKKHIKTVFYTYNKLYKYFRISSAFEHVAGPIHIPILLQICLKDIYIKTDKGTYNIVVSAR